MSGMNKKMLTDWAGTKENVIEIRINLAKYRLCLFCRDYAENMLVLQNGLET